MLSLPLIFTSACSGVPIQTDTDPCTAFGFKRIPYTQSDAALIANTRDPSKPQVISKRLADGVIAHNAKVEENC